MIPNCARSKRLGTLPGQSTAILKTLQSAPPRRSMAQLMPKPHAKNDTNHWLENSRIKQLFDQIQREQRAIKKSIAEQDYIRGETPAGFSNPIIESETVFLFQSQDGQGRQTIAPRGQRMEGTQFWDVDTWRYWLDGTKGDYGIFVRRRVPLKTQQLEQEHARLALQRKTVDTGDALADPNVNQAPLATPMPTPSNKPIIQIVLDVNKLQRRRERQGMAGQFSFGMLEIQPRSTVLEPRDGNTSTTASLAPPDSILAAYSYDTTGDERYNIRIMSLAEDPRRDRIKNLDKLERGNEQLSPLPASVRDEDGDEVDEEEVEETVHHDYEHWGQPEDPSTPGFHSVMLKNAGVGTRWARIGDSLFLYYTQIDHKGLQREVWRVCVQSIDPETGQVVYNKLTPELVMREEDPRLYLALTQTNDRQYLLIESTGQATSHTYALDLNNPSANWTLVREPEKDAIYSVEHHSGYFYIRTNRASHDNFEVLRVPVSAYMSINSIHHDIRSIYPSKFFGGNQSDEVVIPHSADEFLERFEVFVDHFVAWIWREGMQEIRVFDAIKASSDVSSAPTKLPLKERQRLRPWRKDTRIATVLPGCIRSEDDRLYRNFFTTHLQYCNSSFIRPWGLYEYDMNAPPATYGHIDDEDGRKENDEIINNATTLICQDPFPIGVVYGDLSDPCPQKGADASLVNGFVALSTSKDDSHIGCQSEVDSSKLDLEDLILSALERKRSVNDAIEDSSSSSSASSTETRAFPSINNRPKILRFPSLPAPVAAHEKEMAKFTEKRLMVPSTHTPNVSIPVSLVYYDFKGRNFPRPAFVRAYGAYGTMTSGEYDPLVILPLLHRGLVYVQVHPRGDGVLGPRWYQEGKLENKTNTFYDVEDVLLHLKKSGMVMPGGCAIEGRSAGGLVSGWMANRWGETAADMENGGGGDDDDDGEGGGSKSNIVHEMVKVVLAQVPFLDVIGAMADKDIPWVEFEWTEWGNPIESAAIYETMKKYSPYDRIRTQPYPAMMVMGGLSDTRVSYAEPLKYVAKLRSVDGKTNDCQERKGRKKKKERKVRLSTNFVTTEVENENESDEGFERDWETIDGEDDADEGSLVDDEHMDGGSDGEDDSGDGDDDDNKPERPVNDKMCDGQGETPLLLQIEDGGHFSGSTAAWIAFALGELGATKVETPQS
ncbi:hypothetical protein BGZ73_004594 [Actinomortierella ambigua]|nr:hypothetical protein BGZ73_004594 [Actinomortierella ambigua]